MSIGRHIISDYRPADPQTRVRVYDEQMDHPLQCTCGTLKGTVSELRRVNRVKDCQAFAHFLGRTPDILDAKGGTDVIQTLPANVTLTAGQDVLACMRLSEKGLLRWYTKCCNTPIGNTLVDYKISFIGLIHTCVDSSNRSLDESFGPLLPANVHVDRDAARDAADFALISTVLVPVSRGLCGVVGLTRTAPPPRN